jgi:hypothetical protein
MYYTELSITNLYKKWNLIKGNTIKLKVTVIIIGSFEYLKTVNMDYCTEIHGTSGSKEY